MEVSMKSISRFAGLAAALLSCLGIVESFRSPSSTRGEKFSPLKTVPASEASNSAKADTPVLATTPPLRWNSWDGYGTTINQEQVKASAKWFAEHLKAYGWQYVVVDMEWFVTNPTPEGNSKTSLSMNKL